MQDVETIDIGVQIQKGRIEPVARRQSLQWSIATKGRWTFSGWLSEPPEKCSGRSLIAGMSIL